MSDPARKAVLLPACILAALAASPATQAAPPSMTDQLLASQCAQCHGTYGRPVRDIESLAGKSYGSLYSDMIEMRTEGPPSEIMEHQALGYTEDQIRRIALYYSSLSASAPTSSSYTSSTSTSSPTTTTTSSSSDGKRRSLSRYGSSTTTSSPSTTATTSSSSDGKRRSFSRYDN
jgi:sulfide dehydrogenase cytochrome subunit